jgi:hypothetical protein
MEKIISKYKFEFFAVDTYKKYNVWPRKDVRFMSDSTVHKTELFNMSSQWEIPDGKVFTLDKKQSYVSEEYWKKESFNLFVNALVRRVTIVLSKNEKKNQIKLSVFGFTKGKKTGKRYYWKTSNNIHLTFNTKINDFFIISQMKRGSKWFNSINRNHFKGIDKQLLTLAGIIESLLLMNDREQFEKSRDSIGDAWHDILIKLQEELNISSHFIKTKYPTNILNDIVLPWFLSKKDIKLPNNGKKLLIDHYPGIKRLRKSKMNLGKAVLRNREVYSKYSNKLLNTLVDFNIWVYKDFFDAFGKHSIKKLSKELFIRDSHIHIPSEAIKSLSSIEKNNVIRLYNMTLKGSIFSQDISDHLYLQERLGKKDIKVKLKAQNLKEFDAEHLRWSTQLAKAQRVNEITYQYNPLFVDEVERPIQHKFHTYYPVILKNDLEYNEEGSYQKHCVGSYIDRYDCHLISLRREDGTRLTLEYDIDPKKKALSLTQAKLKCNNYPDEEWRKIIFSLEETITYLVKERIYTNPEIKIRNLRTQEIKLIDKDDTNTNNDYVYRELGEINIAPPEEIEYAEPGDLPF